MQYAEDFPDPNSQRKPWEKAWELVRSCFFEAGASLAPACRNLSQTFYWKAACQNEATCGTNTYRLAKTLIHIKKLQKCGKKFKKNFKKLENNFCMQI